MNSNLVLFLKGENLYRGSMSKVSWCPGPDPSPGPGPLVALRQCNSPQEAQVEGVLAEVQLLPPARHR